MGRKAGSTMRCTCRTCGAIEVRRGCNSSFQCTACRPSPPTLKQIAHSAVAVAVRRGDLPRARDCQCADCGGPAIEYEHRDGQWVAADSIGPFPSGATLKVAGDKIVSRVGVTVTVAGGTSYSKPVEPKRAPLPHFNQRTEFDAFPDYVVFHEFEPVAPLHTSPTTDSAYPAIAGLLRG